MALIFPLNIEVGVQPDGCGNFIVPASILQRLLDGLARHALLSPGGGPVRLQRRRDKGFRLESPNGLPVVYVGNPSPWRNPFGIGRDGDRDECARRYAASLSPFDGTVHGYLLESEFIANVRAKLGGKNLACWCPLSYRGCHAEHLLRIANH